MDHSPLTQKFSVELLSPVHIGSGKEYLKGIDFYVRNNQTIFPLMQDLLEVAARDKHILRAFMEINPQSDVGALIRDFRLDRSVRIQKKYDFVCNDKAIREQLCDGNGNPYIPGSSLKGSIRTVIFKRFFDIHYSDKKEEGIFTKALEKKLFGDSAFSDVLKGLLISDTFFKNKDLELSRSRIMNLKREGGWEYKKFSNTVEALRSQSSSSLHLKLDPAKLHPDSSTFPAGLPNSMKALCEWINRHSLHLIEREKAFIEEHDQKNELRGLHDFYQELESRIPEPEQGCLLRLGWGMGYMTVSGDIFEKHNDHLMKIVNNPNYKMRRAANRNWEIFPKTRKLAMQGNRAAASYGWIKLSPE